MGHAGLFRPHSTEQRFIAQEVDQIEQSPELGEHGDLHRV